MNEKMNEKMNENESNATFTKQWRLIQLLSLSKNGLTLEEIAQKTGQNQRTIQRYFALLRENKIPLIEERDKTTGLKRYKITWSTPHFTPDELLAIYMARPFLQPMAGTSQWEAMQRAIDKIRKSFGTKLLQHLDQHGASFAKTKFGSSNYRNKGGFINDLIEAIEKRQKTVLLYTKAKENTPKPLKISPYALVYDDGSWYVIAHSHEREAIRHLKVDRISEVTLTEDTFEKPAQFSLSDHLSDSLGIFRESPDAKTHRVKILFDPFCAKTIREKHWHESERYAERPDGGVLLELRVKELGMLKRWLLSFGRHAKVLAPKELVGMIRKEVADVGKLYEE